MKISVLIEELKKLEKKHGNIEVYTINTDYYEDEVAGDVYIEEISINNENDYVMDWVHLNGYRHGIGLR
jgi:hypothetical protein